MRFLYILPFSYALIAFFSSFLTIKLLFNSYKANNVANKLIGPLIAKLKELDLKSDLDHLLDKHLSEFIATLRQQIPMAGMFLRGSYADKLKTQAKEEFMKMIPELKEKIWQRFSTSDLSFMENMIHESVSKRMLRISLIITAAGFLIGLLHACLATVF